ncbi:MAG TPA: tetratricopeptide repeat protein [Fimbriimonadaceae bacterium]|nr:tetratricopeptide repeat protein [Fimbriimonadaceae bacterium]
MFEPIERDMAAGNWKSALELSEAAVAEHPTSPKAQAYLAWCLVQLDRGSEAVEPLRKAVTLDPHFWQANHQLAQLLDRLGRYAEALEHAKEALKERPGDPKILGLIRGLERQVPEEITDSWQLSTKPMFYTVEFTQNGDPVQTQQRESVEVRPPSGKGPKPNFVPKTDPAT